MSWREFQLKKMGYLRQQKEEWRKTRFIAYYAYASIPEKGQKVPMNKFLPIDEEDSITSSQKEALKEAQKLAIAELKQKKLQNE